MASSASVIATYIAGVGVPVTVLIYVRITKRFNQLERTLSRHTRALRKQSDSLRAVTRGAKRFVDDMEDLEEAVDALQESTKDLRRRLDENDKWRDSLKAVTDKVVTRGVDSS